MAFNVLVAKTTFRSVNTVTLTATGRIDGTFGKPGREWRHSGGAARIAQV